MDYDTVYFECPKCKSKIEKQSKQHECILANFDANEVPIEIGVDLNDTEIMCEHCETWYEIKMLCPVRDVKLVLKRS